MLTLHLRVVRPLLMGVVVVQAITCGEASLGDRRSESQQVKLPRPFPQHSRSHAVPMGLTQTLLMSVSRPTGLYVCQ